jgi:insulysin
MARIKQFKTDPARFGIIKEKLERAYRNFKKSQPYQHAMTYNSLLTYEREWSHEETLAALAAMGPEDVDTFFAEVFAAFVPVLSVHGNTTPAFVRALTRSLDSTLDHAPLDAARLSTMRVVALEPNTTYTLDARTLNDADVNSVIANTFYVGEATVATRALSELLGSMLAEPHYDQLRTKEQLGYLCWAYRSSSANVGVFNFVIQSSERSGAYMDTRVEQFLANYRQTLGAMQQPEFANFVASLVSQKEMKPKSLYEEARRHLAQIKFHNYQFDLRAQVVAELQANVTHERLVAFFDSVLGRNSKDRKKMSVRIWSEHQWASKDEPQQAQGKEEKTQQQQKDGEGSKQEPPADADADADKAEADVDVDVALLEDSTQQVTLSLDGRAAFKAKLALFPDWYARPIVDQ